jgi:hypothetical protein
MAVSFRGRHTPGRTPLGPRKPGCPELAELQYYRRDCHLKGQHGGFDLRDSAIALTRDGGQSWELVGEAGPWHSFPMLVRAERGSSATSDGYSTTSEGGASRKDVIKLLAVREELDAPTGNRSHGELMILDGDATVQSPRKLSWAKVQLPGLVGGRVAVEPGSSGGVGRWGFAAAHSHVLLAASDGHVAFARVMVGGLDGLTISRPPSPFVMQLLPDISSKRGASPLVAFSPDFERDALIVGVNDNSLYVSVDRGRNWSPTLFSTQSTTDCAHLANCARCRLTQVLTPKFNLHSTMDDGALCIACKPGFARVVAPRSSSPTQR